MKIVTIGGYGFTEGTFIRALKNAHVDVFVDLRQRRGVRGAQYAFLNSIKLQQLLASHSIRYVYASELAPTTSIRTAQKEEDQNSGTGKRDRTRLSPFFVDRYKTEILSSFDPAHLRAALSGASVVALFCVEGPPEACHRSLAAEHLVGVLQSNTPVEHLRP